MNVSVPVHAQTELDTLLNTSNSIRVTFDTAIQGIGGLQDLSWQGQIAPDGVLDGGLLTYQQAQDYNTALQDVSGAVYTMDAQTYLNNQAEAAATDMQSAISAFVGAASVLIQVVQVNNITQTAVDSGASADAQAVQTYIDSNTLSISDAQVDTYNQAVETVEVAAQTFASFTAAAADQATVAALQTAADDAGLDFMDAGAAELDLLNQQITFNITDASQNVTALAANVSGFYTDSATVFSTGEQSLFYQTGPTGTDCFFIQDQTARDQCYTDAGVNIPQ